MRIVPYQEWTAGREVVQFGPPHVIKDTKGWRVEIRPSMTRETELLITGRDFVPVRSDGSVLLDQAVHTPSIYVKKKRAVVGDEVQTGTVRRIDEPCFLLGGHANLYHWLVDQLPRFLMAREYAKGLPLIVNGPMAPFQMESLVMLGVTNRLIHVTEDESVLCRSVLFPYLLAQTTVPHPMIPKLIRDAFKPKHGKGRRIYLSRRDATSRRLVNEAELSALLQRYGFETHVTGEMSLADQIALFSEADAVIAAHGAGMANMLFCPPGATVLEVAIKQWRVSSMVLLAQACGLRHKFIDATNIGVGADGNPLLADWFVDLEATERALSGL